MFDDASWSDNDVQGFDWDTSDRIQGGDSDGPAWTFLFANQQLDEPALYEDLDPLTCVMCHKTVCEGFLYENKVVFCSEFCWENAICTCLDDAVVGGMSSWPIDTFVTISAKTTMLNLACASFNGDLIVKLLKSFERSLSPEKFKELLLSNRIAFNHFINFLRKTRNYEYLHDLMMSQGDVEQAKVQKFSMFTQHLDALDEKGAEQLSHKLRLYATTELSNNGVLELLHESVIQLSELLHYQSQHQHAWNSFRLSTRVPEAQSSDDTSSSLLALPLGETIRMLCLMDSDVSIGSRVHSIRTHYKVSDDQFLWLIVEPLVSNANWRELNNAVLIKKRLKRRTETLLPGDRLVLYLHSLGAPRDLLTNLLSCADDQSEIVEIALRLKMYTAALQFCAKTKDLNSMKELLVRIPKNEPEHSRVLYYLSIPVNHWKDNTPGV